MSFVVFKLFKLIFFHKLLKSNSRFFNFKKTFCSAEPSIHETNNKIRNLNILPAKLFETYLLLNIQDFVAQQDVQLNMIVFVILIQLKMQIN